nr:DUF1127 domain-containing protein [Mesorhizobium sp. STM 4661]
MFKSLSRIRAALRRARANKKTIRALNSLPPEVQKDIGWPLPAPTDEIRLPF